MKPRRSFLIFFILLAAAVSLLQAQRPQDRPGPQGFMGPGMYPWWDGPIARDLGLSEEQNRQIRTAVRESRPRMLALSDKVEDAEEELSRLMNADPVDERKTGEAIDRVVAARGELMRAVSQLGLKLRLVLKPAQWQELQKRQPRPPGDGPPQGPNPGPVGARPGGPENRPPKPPPELFESPQP